MTDTYIDLSQAKLCDIHISRSRVASNTRNVPEIVVETFDNSDVSVKAKLDQIRSELAGISKSSKTSDGAVFELNRTCDPIEFVKALEKFFREHDLSVVVDWSTFPKEEQS